MMIKLQTPALQTRRSRHIAYARSQSTRAGVRNTPNTESLTKYASILEFIGSEQL